VLKYYYPALGYDHSSTKFYALVIPEYRTKYIPVFMWIHHKTPVSPTPIANEAKAIPTVTSVDTPT
jgi:hypothetical protein